MVEVWLDSPVSTLMDFSEPPTALQQDSTLLHPGLCRPTFPELPNFQEVVQCCTELQTEKTTRPNLLADTKKG